MASEWPRLRLGDVCIKIGSGATPRGGSEVYVEQGPYALIRSQNIYNDGFHHDGLAYIDKEHAKELENVEVLKDDVLLNITGDSVARACQVDPYILPARVNQHVAIIRPDANKLDASFLRYYLVSPDMQAKLLSWAAAGATRNALTKGMIESFEISAPTTVVEQRSIADILRSMDEKIGLNRKMNETLESMARALFKSWFVDFDPVRAKSEGRDPRLPKSISDLLPDSFGESELGEIPTGWKDYGLDEIAIFLNGHALQKYPPSGEQSLPVIKIAQLRSRSTNDADRASDDIPSAYVIADGDILFSWSGSLECVLWAGGPGALNQHLFKVTSEKYPRWLCYLGTKRHLEDFRHIAAGKATTMGHIQRHHLTDAKLALPPTELLAQMSNYFEPLIESLWLRNVQARTLAAIRDALLPKLISGEIRVKDAQKFVGAVT